jgi:hypothetical protein
LAKAEEEEEKKPKNFSFKLLDRDSADEDDI